MFANNAATLLNRDRYTLRAPRRPLAAVSNLAAANCLELALGGVQAVQTVLGRAARSA